MALNIILNFSIFFYAETGEGSVFHSLSCLIPLNLKVNSALLIVG